MGNTLIHTERIRDIQVVFEPIRKDVATLLESFDTHQQESAMNGLKGDEYETRHP